MNDRTLVDAIEGYIAGDNAIRVEVGVSADSAIKLGIVAVVTTLLCFLIVKMLK
ncbi:MAG: hypothetical protein U0K59_01460 [Bacteroidales bacterium]|nr:hypothetical protein [Bacteroidales bacterium]